MIERRTTYGFKEIVFVCDDCNDEFETAEEDFDAARERVKKEGWANIRNEQGAWENNCATCKPQSNAWKDFL